jgi:hypothetical protein
LEIGGIVYPTSFAPVQALTSHITAFQMNLALYTDVSLQISEEFGRTGFDLDIGDSISQGLEP